MEQTNSLQAVLATFDAYTSPLGSGLGGVGDHTYVLVTNPAVICNCTCYGAAIMPAMPSISTGVGDMRLASCMINMAPALLAVYNGWHDNCGITYGINGVCHQMANRILATVGAPSMPAAAVTGAGFTYMIYGILGGAAGSFAPRLLAATMTALASGLGMQRQDTDSTDEWVFDPKEFIKVKSNLDQYVGRLNDNDVTKLLLQMELYGVSTPEYRLAALYQHYILGDDSSTLQDDPTVKELTRYLQEFIQERDRIYEENKNIIPDWNKAFQDMNRQMHNLLKDKNYKKLFQMDYNPDLCIYEDVTAIDPDAN